MAYPSAGKPFSETLLHGGEEEGTAAPAPAHAHAHANAHAHAHAPAPPACAPRADRLPSLDGLRGVLSVFIVTGHVLTFFVAFDVADPHPSPLVGRVGLEYLTPVSLFVLLSGFSLCLPFLPPREGGGDAGEAGGAPPPPLFPTGASRLRFVCKRWARLAAMYYVSLALAVPLLLYSDLATVIISAVTTPVMVQAVVLSGNGWNGPLWTVSALMACYTVFPLLIRPMRGLGARGLRLTAAGCYLASVAIAVAWLALSPASALALHILGPLRLPQFVVGMAAALLTRAAPPARPAVWVGVASAVLAADVLGCLATVAAVAASDGASAGFNVQQGWAYFAEWVSLPAVAALVMGLSAPVGSAGPIQAVLGSRPAVALGRVSYAAYCIHFPLLLLGGMAVKGGFGPGALPVVWGFAWAPYPAWSTPLLVAAVFVVSAGAHHGVEVPLTRVLVRGVERLGWGGGEGGGAAGDKVPA